MALSTKNGTVATVRQAIVFCLGFAIAAAAIYTAGFGLFDPALHRGLALLTCVFVVALATPCKFPLLGEGRLAAVFGAVVDLIIVSWISWGVVTFIRVDEELTTGLYVFSTADVIAALGAMIGVIELSRRLWGAALALFGVAALLYCFYGDHLGGILNHSGFTQKEIARGIWYGFNGIFGITSSVVVSLVWIFIVMGVILQGTGAGEHLLRMTMSLVGGMRGGPAHAAVFCSGAFGTMSGSAIANVVGTGTFTIPMMVRRGFSRTFAAGIEATASCGGQLVPPVMGAAAFLMSELTNIPYLTIIVAALLPALFYYASLFAAVVFEARRSGIAPIPSSERTKLTWSDAGAAFSFLMPIAAIVYVLLSGYSATMAGFWGTVSAILFGFLNKRMREKPTLLLHVLADAGLSAAKITVAVGVIGIIIGAMNITGLGLRFAGFIDSLGDASLWLSLVLTMFGALILGMGMPTLPAYLIIVLVMGPAIVKMGLPILVVHMFVLYYGVVSSITPPVALAAYAAAPIANASPLATSVTAMRLGAVKFAIPFVFVYNPELLLVLGFDWGALLWLLARLALFVWLVTTGLGGFDSRRLPVWDRIARIGAGIAAVFVVPEVHVVGTVGGVLLIVFHYLRAKMLRTSES